MRYKSSPVHTKSNIQARAKGAGNGELKLKWTGEGTEYEIYDPVRSQEVSIRNSDWQELGGGRGVKQLFLCYLNKKELN